MNLNRTLLSLALIVCCASALSASTVITAPVIISKVKAADLTRASTTTFTDDPDLIIPVQSGETWQFIVTLRARTNGVSSGIKFAFAYPNIAYASSAPAVGFMSNMITAFYSGTPYLPGSGVTFIARDGGTEDLIMFASINVKFSASGNFSLQWAQSTSSATNSTVNMGSSIVAMRLQ